MRTIKLLDALFPKTRQAVLSAMLLHPQRSWYLHELAAHLRVRPSSLQRDLARLVIAGILTRRQERKRILYQAESSCPILAELRSILTKTVGVVDVLRAALASVTARIDWAFVYGSVARTEENSTSDIDLMVVGEVGLADLAPVLRQAERQLGREVNPSVYTLAEFRRKIRAGSHFLTTVWDDQKLVLQGNLNDLATIVGREP